MKNKHLRAFILGFVGIALISGCASQKESTQLNSVSSTSTSNIHYSSSSSDSISSSSKISSDNKSSIITSSSSSNIASNTSSSTITSSSQDEVTVSNISLNYTSDMVYEYHVGDSLNLNNVTINVEYSNGDNENIQVTNDMVTLLNHENKETNMDTAGYIIVSISYEEHTTSYMIEVIDTNGPVDRQDPLVIFNYDAGATFYIGADEKPTVSVLPEHLDYTISYSSDESGYDSTEFPTVAGVYSLVVSFEGDSEYNAIHVWRWFVLAGNKETPTITFDYAAGTTFYIGSDVRPSATVSEGADYTITFSSDTSGYNSTEYPTVAGTYSLVVTVQENDKFSYAKVWRWFRLVEPSTSN